MSCPDLVEPLIEEATICRAQCRRKVFSCLFVLACLAVAVLHNGALRPVPRTGDGLHPYIDLITSRPAATAQKLSTGVGAEKIVAPALSSLELPLWERSLVDVKAMVTAPYRALKLTKITKEVVANTKAKRATDGGASQSSSASSKTLEALMPEYVKSHVIARTDPEVFREHLDTSLKVFKDAFTAEEPYPFKPHHEAIRGPEVDYYAWGNDFFRSLVKFRSSRVEGLEYVQEIKRLTDAGDNVVLLANHQTEADPQVLSMLTEMKGYPEIGEDAIFVAGHKVTTDRLAVPFSMGRNLITIFSKKYLHTFDEEERLAKNERNSQAVSEIQRLLGIGGKLIWVAPSGGRDRRSPESGRFVPASFDPQSVGLFYLLGQKAQKAGPKTHFFPLAMWTHGLMPPPEGEKAQVGEARSAARAPIAIEFGPEIKVDEIGGRKKLPAIAEQAVRTQYENLDKLMR